jgi:LAO/AO transport system kinase
VEAELLEKIRKGDRLALSRILTAVEAKTMQGEGYLDALFSSTGKAHKIGITGPPGSGKSTLVNALVKAFRELDSKPKVAVLAVDPTSPFSGGAILGDRVRMLDTQSDPGVFIRSMASRGALGGLAERTEALSQIFDAAGYDLIFIETVGAGQSEVDIVNLAHTTIVVDVPGLGDDIQSIKAGILEIADILVINKADHPGADQTLRNLKTMIAMGKPSRELIASKHALQEIGNRPKETHADPLIWTPPVHKTIASQQEGIHNVVKTILKHKDYLVKSGTFQIKDHEILRRSLERQLSQSLYRAWQKNASQKEIEAVIAKLIRREISPKEALNRLMAL